MTDIIKDTEKKHKKDSEHFAKILIGVIVPVIFVVLSIIFPPFFGLLICGAIVFPCLWMFAWVGMGSTLARVQKIERRGQY